MTIEDVRGTKRVRKDTRDGGAVKDVREKWKKCVVR